MKSYSNFYEIPDRSLKARIKCVIFMQYAETWPDRLFFGMIYATIVTLAVAPFL